MKVLLYLVLQKAAQFEDSPRPAVFVTIACRDIEKLFVQHVELRAAGRRAEGERQQRFALGRALPRPGEYQFAVRLHFTINAADVVLFPVDRAEDDMKAATHAHV